MKKNTLLAVLALNTLNSIAAMAQNDSGINPIGSVFICEESTAPTGTFRLISGGFEVYTISSADKTFQPASLYYGKDDADKNKIDALVPDGKVPTAMNCFVVRTPGG